MSGSRHLPRVTFYLPFANDGIAALPSTLDEYWPWLAKHRRAGSGKYAWTLQTYLHLKNAGLPCEMTHRFPSRGIVISHRDFLPVFLRPRLGVFLICIKPDRKEHTWAHYYVVQNRRDSILQSRKGRDRTTVLHVWPQPALVPRRAERTACCNVSYFGRRLNLADELRTDEWTRELAALGFNWSISNLEAWHDYSSVDVTVAVRSFGTCDGDDDPVTKADSKPPSKLINSWIAGVPAIVGRESAYENIRQSPLDYIEVKTTDDVKAALVELRENRDLYNRMVAHGRVRARDYSTDALLRRWRDTLGTEISRVYAQWRESTAFERSCSSARDILEYFRHIEHWRHLRTISRTQRQR